MRKTTQAAIIQVMTETAGAPDVATFCHRLFEQLDDVLDLPLAALNYRGGIGPVRVSQSKHYSERELRERFPEVVAEQVALLSNPVPTEVNVVSEAIPAAVLDEMETFHTIWRPNNIRDGVTSTFSGTSGMRLH